MALGHVIVMYDKVTVVGQSWNDHGTIMGQSRDNHVRCQGIIIGRSCEMSWDNHGTIIILEHSWDNHGTIIILEHSWDNHVRCNEAITGKSWDKYVNSCESVCFVACRLQSWWQIMWSSTALT